MFEWKDLNVGGNLITIMSILFVGAGFYYRQIFDSKIFRENIVEIKNDLKILNKLVTDIALQNQRLDNQGERFNQVDKTIEALRMEIRELKHWKGFINPPDGEYPKRDNNQ